MAATVQAPFGPTVERTRLGDLGPEIGNPGQCLAVRPLKKHSGLLFKEYRPGQLTAADENRLASLIGLPGRMESGADRRLLLESTSWPQTRVIENQRTVGVLVPRAPDRFYATLRSPYGDSERMPVAIDHLAMPDDRFPPLGLKAPGLERRLAVCRGLAAVADLFERHGVVYGDWGYQNAFWSPNDGSVYLIDADGCSFGPQPWVESIGFEDPLTPSGELVDAYSDRFRCAIMICACLVGARQQRQAVTGLAAVRAEDAALDRVSTVLRQIVTSSSREGRLALCEVRAALVVKPRVVVPAAGGNGAAAPSGVVGWEPVERPDGLSAPYREPEPIWLSLPEKKPEPVGPSMSHKKPEPARKVPPANPFGGFPTAFAVVMVAVVALLLLAVFTH